MPQKVLFPVLESIAGAGVLPPPVHIHMVCLVLMSSQKQEL